MGHTSKVGPEAPAREIDVFCPEHSLSLGVKATKGIVCAHNGHELDYSFPDGWFWEYCCDCATFVHSDIVAERKPRNSCPACSRQFVRRFICDKCHVITCDSDKPAPRRAFSLSSAGSPAPTCPGCLALSVDDPRLHECVDFGFKFLTTRTVCPFCRNLISPQKEKETSLGTEDVKRGHASAGRASQLNCPACHAPIKPHFKFCKKCRAPLKPETPALVPVQSALITQTPVQPVATFANDSPHSLDSTDTSEIFAAPSDDHQPVASAISTKLISALVAIVILIGILAISAAYRTVSSNSSTAGKLNKAIALGHLVAPQGESARDYYNQLMNEDGSVATLAPYRQRLMPQLTQRPQQLLDDLTRPGGRDGTLPEWEESQQLLAWAAELTPDDKQLAAKAAYAQGRTAYLNNLVEQALTAYQRAADLDTSWAVPLNSIGSMLNEHKRYSESRKFLRQAIQRNPNWALPYNNMGTSFFFENNLSDAESNYQKAIQLAPNWARPHAWLGSIASKQKAYCSAIGEFERALSLPTVGMSNWDPQKIQRELDLARSQCVTEVE